MNYIIHNVARLLRAPRTIYRMIIDGWFGPWWISTLGIHCGDGLILSGLPRITTAYNGNIFIGNNVMLHSRCDSNPLQLLSPCHLCCFERNSSIIISDDVGISGSVVIAATSIYIGKRTLIGANCIILDTDFHPLLPEERIASATKGAKTKAISIGDDCFIGTRAIILRGTVLGDGCVVGAGAVVSGQFPGNCIIAGNPAKIIKHL